MPGSSVDAAPPPDALPPAGPRRRWLTSVKGWAVELIIVFVGVYAAFALSEYQQRQQAVVHRAQIEQALLQEIEEITFRARRAAEGISGLVAYYDSSIAAGAMPPLQPSLEPISVRHHMWEATLQSGGLNVLEVTTLYRISAFYNALNAGFEQLAQLRTLSEQVLLPNLDQGPEAFYDPTTKQLRPQYTWYLEGLRRTGILSSEVATLGTALIEDLKDPETQDPSD